MIAGTDIVFWTPDPSAAARVILRIVCGRWKDYVFQNADDPAPTPRPAGGALPVPPGDQFFVYRDEAAARSWEELGAVPENANTMLHVLVGKRRQTGTGYGSLTLVCDEAAGEMKELLDEIEAALMSPGHDGNGVGAPLTGAAAPK